MSEEYKGPAQGQGDLSNTANLQKQYSERFKPAMSFEGGYWSEPGSYIVRVKERHLPAYAGSLPQSFDSLESAVDEAFYCLTATDVVPVEIWKIDMDSTVVVLDKEALAEAMEQRLEDLED